MPWMPVKFPPGIFKDTTHYDTQGRWYDCNLVRFREGKPERWGGWTKALGDLQVDGIARSIFRHAALDGTVWHSVGTSKRFYMVYSDTEYDVTPIETTTTLGTDPLDTTSGSNEIVVNDTAHGRQVGDILIMSGATAVGGIGTGELNAEHEITEYIDADSYKITVTSNATSTASGGGGSVQVEYLYNPGSVDSISGDGWGRGWWGQGAWGNPLSSSGPVIKLGQWSQGNWGEDLVACIKDGPIFYWDRTNADTRMVDILDLGSADGNAPSSAQFIVISDRDRHLLAFGGTSYGGSTVNPVEIRWCDQENILNWDEADTTGTAGSLPLTSGSYFLAAQKTSKEILVWTDTALYSLQYIGAPLIYAANVIDDYSDIVGLKAATSINNVVYWMGRSGIYMYDGSVKKIRCPVWDYVSQRWDKDQLAKVFVSTNAAFSEIIFFYPSSGATDLDSYITYNFMEDHWTVGSLERTAWFDGDAIYGPLAVDHSGYMYEHESGADDGSTNPSQAISAYIESAPFELSVEGSFDKGDRFFFIRRILPDVTFRAYTNDEMDTPEMNIVLKSIDKPGGGLTTNTTSTVTRTAILPVSQYTDDLQVRLRGRGVIIRAESDTTGTLWRLGTPRLDIRPDGQR